MIERFDTYGIFKIIKVYPNNITVNQVSRMIAYTKKIQFVHKTNGQTQEPKYYVRLKLSKKLFTKNCEGNNVIFKKIMGLS